MTSERAGDRTVLEITGEDALHFLQGLVTNDVERPSDGLVYTALLTPQGKYLADFFVVRDAGRLLLDVSSDLAADLVQRLSMYKLRSKVAITETDLAVTRGLGPAPGGAHADPRHPDLGWRRYGADTDETPTIDWDRIRVTHCIPETGVELIPNETFILEAGLDRLNGVDFRKGCYVGQEVTARMKHKTELKKGLARVRVDGAAPVGTAITAGDKPAGTLYTQADGAGIAYLRFDRAKGEMRAGAATLTRAP